MSSTATIIIPFRSLLEGKSRLAPVLSKEERAQLNREMLEGVAGAALDVAQHPKVLVISPDEAALEMVQHFDPRIQPVYQEPRVIGLNGALEFATDLAIDAGSRVVVVIPADLPLLRSADIENLVRRDAPVVIAPDRRRRGTNGLMQRIDATLGNFRYQFGPDSYALHQEQAHRLGLDPVSAVSLGTSFDLDTPADLRDLAGFDRTTQSIREGSLACG